MCVRAIKGKKARAINTKFVVQCGSKSGPNIFRIMTFIASNRPT